MSFEDDMIDYGFTDGNDYLDFLSDQAEEMYALQEEQERKWQESEESYEIDRIERIEKEKERRRIQSIKENEEKCEILMLMCWIKENPQNARIWYASFTKSTNVHPCDFEELLNKLTAKDEDFMSELIKKSVDSCFFKFYLELFKGAYKDWEYWISRHEEYEEFKRKSPDLWKSFVDSIKLSYIKPIICYNGLDDLFLEDHRISQINTYKTYNLLQSWIEDNKSLWKDISVSHTYPPKSEDIYLMQAWLDNFEPLDYFDIWKENHKNTWKSQLDDDININKNKIRFDEEKLFNDFVRVKGIRWNSWLKKNQDYYQINLKVYKELLWYAYTETKWLEHLKDIELNKEIKKYEESKIGDSQIEENCNFVDYKDDVDDLDDIEDEIFEPIVFEDEYDINPFNDEHSFFSTDLSLLHPDDDDEKALNVAANYNLITNRGLVRYFLTELNCSDILQIKKYNNEFEIYKALIENYYKELKDNIDKHKFIKDYCNESEVESLLSERFVTFESAEIYADRKLREYWIEKHKVQWEMWKYNFYWKEIYSPEPSRSNGYKIGCTYSLQENFDAWKCKHKKKWNKWLSKNLQNYKSMVQSIDLWYTWFEEGDNYIIFEKWAKSHIVGWNESKDSNKNYDIRNVCFQMFGLSEEKYDLWRKDKNDEWVYWKDAIEEEVYIEKFSYSRIDIPYNKGYKLKLFIEEMRYKSLIGLEIFHNNLAVVSYGTKYGYINEKFQIAIPLQYDYARDFQNDLAFVRVNEHYFKYILCKDETFLFGFGKWGIINKKGEYIRTPQYDSISHTFNGFIIFSVGGEPDMDRHCYKNSKFGIMNRKLEIIAEPKYSSIEQLENKLFVAGIKEDGALEKFGLLSKEAKEITPFKYSHIYNSYGNLMRANTDSVLEEFYEGESVYHNGLWGYLNIDGQETAPFVSAYDEDDFYEITHNK